MREDRKADRGGAAERFSEKGRAVQVERCRKNRGAVLAGILLLAGLLAGCIGINHSAGKQEPPHETEKNTIVIGFSQLGAESDWRNANSESMRSTFTEQNGYTLIFEDGQQKQSNQITAIRRFIQQEVDYIVLAPVTETGWDTVLNEAREAGIPVIIVDRMVDVEDDELYSCRVGSDFLMEGKKAAQWLHEFTSRKGLKGEDLHIVDIQGNLGATAQIGRTMGLADAARLYGWDLKAAVPGDFTQTKGREVMAELLKQYDDINVVYCENDNEAFGALEAIEAAGKKTGSDIEGGEILVISFDGVNRNALELALKDRITCIAQCNPMQGPLVQALIEDLEAGKQPPKVSYMDEEIYCADDTVKNLRINGVEYPVTLLTEEVIEKRGY